MTVSTAVFNVLFEVLLWLNDNQIHIMYFVIIVL